MSTSGQRLSGIRVLVAFPSVDTAEKFCTGQMRILCGCAYCLNVSLLMPSRTTLYYVQGAILMAWYNVLEPWTYLETEAGLRAFLLTHAS